MPEEQVAVQAPVIVVGGAAVVGLAASQLAADLLDEHGPVLFGDDALPLLGGELGVHVLQLLGGEEEHIPAQVGVQAGKLPLQLVQSAADGADNPADGVL